jgi:hypothetical protein
MGVVRCHNLRCQKASWSQVEWAERFETPPFRINLSAAATEAKY